VIVARADVLVDGDWLKEHLTEPAVVAIEVDEDSDAYYTSHIPGAIALNWRADLQDPLRRDFIDRAGFEALLSDKDVTAEDTVILYGGNNNWFATYAYWYFKVYGHHDVRPARRRPQALGARRPPAEHRPGPAPHDHLQRPGRRPLDPSVPRRGHRLHRRQEHRRRPLSAGVLRPDPRPAQFPQEQPQKPGHVPTAVNVPWSKAAAEDGTFRSDEQLRALYADAGVDLSGERDTVVYCRIGERSAHTWFVLRELLDQPQVKNYDGSWVEYGSLIGAPIEK
jgi:thiosulfate/3-mercaptopyruvate sulfurtransferase